MNQEHYFDQLTKLTAAGLPRREALRRVGAVLGGALLGSLGLGRAASGQIPGDCATYCNTNFPIATKGKKANSACISTCNSTACGGDPSKLCGTITPAPYRNTLVCCGSGQTCNAGVCTSADPCAGIKCKSYGSGECVVQDVCINGVCQPGRPTDGMVCSGIPGFCVRNVCQAGNCTPFFSPPGSPCPGGTCDVRGICVSCPEPVSDPVCTMNGLRCFHPGTGDGFCLSGLCIPFCAEGT